LPSAWAGALGKVIFLKKIKKHFAECPSWRQNLLGRALSKMLLMTSVVTAEKKFQVSR
jgi:hypothetical protein